ncbi:predicted D-glycerate permease [Chitinophaga eiseniae]|uniref:Predicted D-glycerate permease n=1 Tax=Chitinophaga eiseniae TaxID=634771 RepID=A0A1T4T0J5_9BACT|nr:GntP family permease [Chitinophaga eiseniae]SKA33994.1 predicted D-glycerate permease [Chitinophaga eiseniae]
MNNISLLQSISGLLAGIALIVILTARFRIHAFFALLLAGLLAGLIFQLSLTDILTTIKTGFGQIIGSLGLLIILGTTLGLILEHTGSTTVLAAYVLRQTGTRRSPLALNIIGYLVGMPIFCDSGFIVLSGLNKALALRSGVSMVIMASSLATGLYAVHCMMPPHPGITAAMGVIEADIGRVMLFGLLIALPASFCGYAWSLYAGRRLPVVAPAAMETDSTPAALPSVLMSVLPIAVPILLIALRSFFTLEQKTLSLPLQLLNLAGMPEIAITIGIVLALSGMRKNQGDSFRKILQEGAEKAAGILVIIGGGGAFGAILAKAGIGEHIASNPAITGTGILLPFIVTAILKTAQGSSTVAIITAASIIHPLLPALGLHTPDGSLLCVLAMGAGSMMVSHTNDAYFWVITRFSGLEVKDMLRVYTMATLVMGIVAMLGVYLLSRLIL